MSTPDMRYDALVEGPVVTIRYPTNDRPDVLGVFIVMPDGTRAEGEFTCGAWLAVAEHLQPMTGRGAAAEAVKAEREACCRIVCGWCNWKGPQPSQGLASVSPAELRDTGTWREWQHRLDYKTGEERWTECRAGEIRDRGSA